PDTSRDTRDEGRVVQDELLAQRARAGRLELDPHRLDVEARHEVLDLVVEVLHERGGRGRRCEVLDRGRPLRGDQRRRDVAVAQGLAESWCHGSLLSQARGWAWV